MSGTGFTASRRASGPLRRYQDDLQRGSRHLGAFDALQRRVAGDDLSAPSQLLDDLIATYRGPFRGRVQVDTEVVGRLPAGLGRGDPVFGSFVEDEPVRRRAVELGGRGGAVLRRRGRLESLQSALDRDGSPFRSAQRLGERPEDVEAAQKSVDHRRRRLQIALPHAVEEALHRVGQLGHGVVAEHRRRTLQGVGRSEYFLDDLGVFSAALQLQDALVEHLELLFRFLEEDNQVVGCDVGGKLHEGLGSSSRRRSRAPLRRPRRPRE